jgi:hypothetical protein
MAVPPDAEHQHAARHAHATRRQRASAEEGEAEGDRRRPLEPRQPTDESREGNGGDEEDGGECHAADQGSPDQLPPVARQTAEERLGILVDVASDAGGKARLCGDELALSLPVPFLQSLRQAFELRVDGCEDRVLTNQEPPELQRGTCWVGSEALFQGFPLEIANVRPGFRQPCPDGPPPGIAPAALMCDLFPQAFAGVFLQSVADLRHQILRGAQLFGLFGTSCASVAAMSLSTRLGVPQDQSDSHGLETARTRSCRVFSACSISARRSRRSCTSCRISLTA